MELVENLEKTAANYEEYAADNRTRAANKRAEAERLEKEASEDETRAAAYRQAAKVMGKNTESDTIGMAVNVASSVGNDAAYEDRYLRNQALSYASQLGGHHSDILTAAAAYYAFLTTK